jgi:murein L,D-transpeptidase YafK
MRLAAAAKLAASGDNTGKAAIARDRQELESMLAERVTAWAAAWSARTLDAYVDFYAPSFVAADGASRETWAKQRAVRLATPSRIQVKVSDINLKNAAKDVLVVEFVQDYSSDSYRDSTRKLLKWIRVGEQWLIAQETARPLSAGGATRRKAEK